MVIESLFMNHVQRVHVFILLTYYILHSKKFLLFAFVTTLSTLNGPAFMC